MRNLYPLVAQAEVSADLDEAVASGEQNRDPSGSGWTAVHVIKPPSTSYVEARLLLLDAAAALERIMPRVKLFNATISGAMASSERDPLGSYEEDAWCFGFGPHCYLKLDAAGEHVKYIWFDLNSSAPSDVMALRLSMQAIDRLVPSFIADYSMEAEAIIADAQMLDQYFARRAAEIEAAEA